MSPSYASAALPSCIPVERKARLPTTGPQKPHALTVFNGGEHAVLCAKTKDALGLLYAARDHEASFVRILTILNRLWAYDERYVDIFGRSKCSSLFFFLFKERCNSKKDGPGGISKRYIY